VLSGSKMNKKDEKFFFIPFWFAIAPGTAHNFCPAPLQARYIS